MGRAHVGGPVHEVGEKRELPLDIALVPAAIDHKHGARFTSLCAGDGGRGVAEALAAGDDYAGTIGTPDDARRQLRGLADAGVDQVIFIQQAGRNRHEDICASLELFAREVMPSFHADEPSRLARKQAELAPYVEAALARKPWMKPLAAAEVPIVRASVEHAQVPKRGVL